jgi:hypothetical protein
MLTEKDRWVGEAITNARVAYGCWIGLLKGEITVEPEFSASLPGGPYLNLFSNYSKREFLRAVSILHRGFIKKDKVTKKWRKEPVVDRISEVVPADKIDEFLRLAEPFRRFRNEEEHRENPLHPRVWTVQINQPRPTIGTSFGNRVDPFPVYEILKSLEPDIGYFAFLKVSSKESRSTQEIRIG